MIKLYICCLVFIIGSVEVDPDMDIKFRQVVMKIVSNDKLKISPPPQNYTPSMFWLRQYAMVIDLFIYTFEYYQFHHKLINAIDGCM